ncbi:MAG: YggS family pyridoxal phosphate-dependent enzyme [Pirellula sp.]|jgi:pyridoxal phosphate enzyme (YggS family)
MAENTVSAARIRENYLEIQGLVADAASRSGRSADAVRIVGVTKYVDIAAALAVVEAGCIDLGESRPQSLWDKAAQLPNSVRWHLIGHLQRNKCKRTLPLLHRLHSLDSWRLAEQIAADAAPLQAPVQALLEVNLTLDPAKTGLPPEAALPWLQQYLNDPNVRQRLHIAGLMGMSSLAADRDQTRREFAHLRELRDRWSHELEWPLQELSMGMSDDFEIAIEEGSTCVRIGSRFFRDPDASTSGAAVG